LGSTADNDPGFPSGAWVGFYTYYARDIRHRMELHLTFERSAVRGDGIDDVGKFTIQGRYATDTRECHWQKSYLGSHQVFYRGAQRGRMIAGRWEIGTSMSGSFCIWPRAFGELTGEFFVEEEEAESPVSDALAEAVRTSKAGVANDLLNGAAILFGFADRGGHAGQHDA